MNLYLLYAKNPEAVKEGDPISFVIQFPGSPAELLQYIKDNNIGNGVEYNGKTLPLKDNTPTILCQHVKVTAVAKTTEEKSEKEESEAPMVEAPLQGDGLEHLPMGEHDEMFAD